MGGNWDPYGERGGAVENTLRWDFGCAPMRDMPLNRMCWCVICRAFLKICARICLRYAKICRTPGSKCQSLDMTTYKLGNFWKLFSFLKYLRNMYSPEICLFCQIGIWGEILDFKVGQFNQVDLLFVLHEWRWRGRQILWLIPATRKGGRMCLNYQFLSSGCSRNPFELEALAI